MWLMYLLQVTTVVPVASDRASHMLATGSSHQPCCDVHVPQHNVAVQAMPVNSVNLSRPGVSQTS